MKLTDPLYADFSDQAKQVIQLANEEAERLSHEYIGSEHILLGLVKNESCIATRALQNLDSDVLSKIRHDLEMVVQPGPHSSRIENRPLTPKAHHVVKSAIEEARRLKIKSVGTEHLLLGLFQPFEAEKTLAGMILSNLNLQRDRVRKEVIELLQKENSRNSSPE